MMRARIADSTVRCGRPRCRGVLGTLTFVTPVHADGCEEPASPLFRLPSIFVRHVDAEGEIWEEPGPRRARRLRGLRSEHRLGRLAKLPDGQLETLPRASFKATQLPIRVRCPRCDWISVVDQDHLQGDVGRSMR